MKGNSPESGDQLSNRSVGFDKLFGALRITQFRWIWSSSMFAALVQTLGLLTTGWLVLQVTNSAFWVGVSAGISGLGQLAFGVLGGVLADRVDRRYALIFFQCFTGILFFSLGLLVLNDLASLPVIFFILFLRGVTIAGILPFSNSLTFDVVGRNLILNAMAARLTAMNLSRILGGIIGGLLIGFVGTGVTLVIIRAIAVIGSIPLLFIRRRENIDRFDEKESLVKMARQGIDYAVKNKAVRSLLFLSVLMEMFGFSHIIMLPVIARDVLGVGPSGLGMLSSAGGIGALVGTLGIASLDEYPAKHRLLLITSCASGMFLILFAASQWFVLSLFMAACVSLALLAYDSLMAAILALMSRDEMRGRIMGLHGLTFGFTPLGGFIAGAIASAIGSSFAVGIGGVAVLTYIFLTRHGLSDLTEEINAVK